MTKTNTKIDVIENESKNKIIEMHCISCKRTTRNTVHVSLDKHGEEGDTANRWSINWLDRFQVLECNGCATVSFRHESWFSEDQWGDDDGVKERIYPLRDKDAIAAKPYHNVPSNLRRIYKEIIDCFNIDSSTLCAAGLRALVEGICAEQKIVDGPVEVQAKGGGLQTVRRDNLQGKIAGLMEKGLLTRMSAQTLHEHRALGNDAVHELARPSNDELKLALEVIEHVLDQLYELPEKAAELQRARAQRQRKNSGMT